MPMPTADRPRGLTVPEVARLLRCRPSKVRSWIAAGELAAVDMSAAGSRPRLVILPEQLREFTDGRPAARPKPPRRKRKPWTEFIQ
jgi:excisionase family DNA binding protein